MLLQKLKEYADRSEDNIPLAHKQGKIDWFIDLDTEGNLVGEGFVASRGGDKKAESKEFIISHIKRSAGVVPNLLVDNAGYVLGISDETSKDESKAARRADDCHNAFIELLEDCFEYTASSKVRAVSNFLKSLPSYKLEYPVELKKDSILSFRVDGEMPTDEDSVMKFWAEKNTASDGTKDLVQCHICGEQCVPARLHPVGIKGIPGGQTSGMMMVSANKDAFESYALEKSLIAPTCWQCAEGYAKAANNLIKDKNSRVFIGPLVYLFWTKNRVSPSFLKFFSDPKPDSKEVKELIISAQKGSLYEVLDDEKFYATAWSASGARIAVREWLETTVGDVKKNMIRWFSMQSLERKTDDVQEFFGAWVLAASLYSGKNVNNQMAPQVPQALLKVALKGGELPPWILYQAVRRNRAEREITRPRLILIKMVLVSKKNIKEDCFVSLDTENRNPAYLCGRLLAELESIQKEAVNPKATILDKFYGSASSAPASVFGYLIKGSQSHLAKLRKEKPGLAVIFQKRLGDIHSGLDAFPRILTLEEQGLFSLGYYHQKVSGYSKKKEGVTTNG